MARCKVGGPLSALTLKTSHDIKVHFSLNAPTMYKKCTFQEVDAFSNYYISTSKIHNKFF